jgi:hypothetical protein
MRQRTMALAFAPLTCWAMLVAACGGEVAPLRPLVEIDSSRAR